MPQKQITTLELYKSSTPINTDLESAVVGKQGCRLKQLCCRLRATRLVHVRRGAVRRSHVIAQATLKDGKLNVTVALKTPAPHTVAFDKQRLADEVTIAVQGVISAATAERLEDDAAFQWRNVRRAQKARPGARALREADPSLHADLRVLQRADVALRAESAALQEEHDRLQAEAAAVTAASVQAELLVTLRDHLTTMREQLQALLGAAGHAAAPCGCSERTVAELESRPVTAQEHDDGAGCAICLVDFEIDSPARALPCGHCFHEACISRWLHGHHTCPVCRYELPAESAKEGAEALPPGGEFVNEQLAAVAGLSTTMAGVEEGPGNQERLQALAGQRERLRGVQQRLEGVSRQQQEQRARQQVHEQRLSARLALALAAARGGAAACAVVCDCGSERGDREECPACQYPQTHIAGSVAVKAAGLVDEDTRELHQQAVAEVGLLQEELAAGNWPRGFWDDERNSESTAATGAASAAE